MVLLSLSSGRCISIPAKSSWPSDVLDACVPAFCGEGFGSADLPVTDREKLGVEKLFRVIPVNTIEIQKQASVEEVERQLKDKDN